MQKNRFDQALQALDALHAADPKEVAAGAQTLPLELWHAQRMSAWLERIRPDASETLRLAVRGQHLQRWRVPRSDYPAGRQGYLSWRRDQGQRAGETTAALMRDAGYDPTDAERAAALIRKEGLGTDADTQSLEDCACLVFLENYFADFSRRVDHAHMVRILRKTWRKMSPQAHELALALSMPDDARRLVEEAVSV
ncbi:hypothetical protein J2T57_000156 [Natronocella acetinitrilica]|uniref:DUF4202 family protein n=1 Tax=Natronocella acetinitrilica TaxID=414046 RepID=A0AAE3G165_9GAMM|nr:DUF4202 domain-containing protein [Natronocella acetinitrilica]MCP1673064.1 hypothetical protein [Natronocella acetinitrilica]